VCAPDRQSSSEVYTSDRLPRTSINSAARDGPASVAGAVALTAWTQIGHGQKKEVTFSRNLLFCLVELAGVEPASEIPTSSVLHA